MGRLWLCVHLPMWSVDRARRRGQATSSVERSRPDVSQAPSPAVLLYREHHGKQEVVMACEHAKARGVRPGVTVAQATALLEGPVWTKLHEPEQDAVALQALARWCLRLTPRVEGFSDEPGEDRLVLDMTGCERLYGGAYRMVEMVLVALRRLRLTVRAALAPTRAGAEALARRDDTNVCVVLDLAEMQSRLDALPTDALGLNASEIEGLAEVGIDRIEQLRGIDRHEVASRFGPGVLKRLDQARGELACDNLDPVKRWEPPEVAIRFAGPTTQFEAVQQAVEQLCNQLAQRLRSRLRSAATLTLEAERLDENLRGEFVKQTVDLSRPSRDARHLWAMLRPHVERLHLGHGVEALALTAKQAPRVGLTQLGPKDERAQDAELAAAEAELVDVLSAKLGPTRVLRPRPVATHVPESNVCWRPAVETRHLSSLVSSQDPAWSNAPPLVRPTCLLEPIEPAQVTLLNPEGPVLTLRWRGSTRRLVTSIGPERIAPRWWKSAALRVVTSPNQAGSEEEPLPGATTSSRITPDPQPRPRHRKVDTLLKPKPEAATNEPDDEPPLPPLWSDLAARDYYRVQDETGLWLWVFRRLDTGKWSVHGVWG